MARSAKLSVASRHLDPRRHPPDAPVARDRRAVDELGSRPHACSLISGLDGETVDTAEHMPVALMLRAVTAARGEKRRAFNQD